MSEDNKREERKERRKLAGIVAEMEQFEAHVTEVAKVIGSYFKQLVDSGIPENTAIDLTKNYHSMLWNILLKKVEFDND